jgi:hypothetical protein
MFLGPDPDPSVRGMDPDPDLYSYLQSYRRSLHPSKENDRQCGGSRSGIQESRVQKNYTSLYTSFCVSALGRSSTLHSPVHCNLDTFSLRTSHAFSWENVRLQLIFSAPNPYFVVLFSESKVLIDINRQESFKGNYGTNNETNTDEGHCCGGAIGSVVHMYEYDF